MGWILLIDAQEVSKLIKNIASKTRIIRVDDFFLFCRKSSKTECKKIIKNYAKKI